MTKYISVLIFVGTMILAFYAGVYFRSFAINSLVKAPLEKEVSNIAENYNKNIWCKFENTLDKYKNSNENTRNKDAEYNRFLNSSKLLFTAIPYAKVSLLNNNHKEIVSSNNKSRMNFDQSPNDKIINPIDENKIVKNKYIRVTKEITALNCDETPTNTESPVSSYLVFYHDISKLSQNFYHFQIIITLGILLIICFLYLSLYLTSRKTERIITKQHDEKIALEKAKSIAEERNYQKSMFLANVSHELRTPLNAIIGFSEIIKDEVMGPVGNPQYKEYVQDINTSGIHLLSLINDILDYSKAEARKLDVEIINIDLTKIVKSCFRLVEQRATEGKIELISEIPISQVLLEADPKRMKQVILNLLSNAVKFTPEGEQVKVKIIEKILEQRIILSVEDSGIGISQKNISKAMSPFGQIDSSISRKYEGTGLGLPLARKLTEIMGGVFSIKSELGLGTTVTIEFPVKNLNKQKDNESF